MIEDPKGSSLVASTHNGFRRRVALVALHFTEYSCLLAKALAKNHDVLLLLDANAIAEEMGDVLPSGDALTVQLINRSRSFSGLIENLRQANSVIVDFRPDVVHFQEVATPLGIALAMRHLLLPMVLTVHDPRPHSGDDDCSFSQIRQRGTLALFRRLSDVVITHGEVLREHLETDYPRLRGRVCSVPHGPLGGPRAAEAPEHGNFLFFGRVQKYKGLGFFVEAIERLHAAGRLVKGVITGRGPDLESYRARILNHPAFELHERFIREDELPGFFGRAQAVVLPYTDGTQSGVAAMALGFGRPVVSTRVGAVQDMVRDGDNGLLIAPCDAGALSAALLRILGDGEMARCMGERSHELGCTELSWVRNAEISGQAYMQALALRGRL